MLVPSNSLLEPTTLRPEGGSSCGACAGWGRGDTCQAPNGFLFFPHLSLVFFCLEYVTVVAAAKKGAGSVDVQRWRP